MAMATTDMICCKTATGSASTIVCSAARDDERQQVCSPLVARATCFGR
jgi:hypothetical protein